MYDEDSLYKPGDRVLIADELGECRNPSGEMDKYCGTVMTIKRKSLWGTYYEMEEDGGMWGWYTEMIVGLAEDLADQVDEGPAPVVREISFEEIMLGTTV